MLKCLGLVKQEITTASHCQTTTNRKNLVLRVSQITPVFQKQFLAIYCYRKVAFWSVQQIIKLQLKESRKEGKLGYNCENVWVSLKGNLLVKSGGFFSHHNASHCQNDEQNVVFSQNQNTKKQYCEQCYRYIKQSSLR